MNELETQKPKSNVAKLIIVIWLLLGVAVVVFLHPSQILKDINQWIQSLGYIAPVAYIVIYVLFCIFLIPSMALSLGVAPFFGFWQGLLWTVIAANIGATVAYCLGRTLLRKRVERWALDKPRFQAIDDAVALNSLKIVTLLRMSPIFPFTIFNYLLSLMRVKYWQFALGTFIGMLPLNAAFLYVGCAAKELVDEVGKERVHVMEIALRVFGIVMACVAITVVSRIALKAVKKSGG